MYLFEIKVEDGVVKELLGFQCFVMVIASKSPLGYYKSNYIYQKKKITLTQTNKITLNNCFRPKLCSTHVI